ncbi:hypothetical protein JYU34_000330 [Plutella xylostella]|uniref:Uncharacterized protein n=1 Tax=Plutella xylostella TaxID=51655 RepID=A0ABQ7R7J6_PLUXY|nr:hypothetical protein JYU34_000330 [Plutella xylostella]
MEPCLCRPEDSVGDQIVPGAGSWGGVAFSAGLPDPWLQMQTSELESLLCKQEGASLAPVHMEFFDGGSSRDDGFLRPALWEDIASSIRNIDPENANMLAPLGATHVKLEAAELLEECATPMLSPLEIKTEQRPPAYAPPPPQPAYHKYPPSRLVYMSPLTPPGSDQGSPGNTMQGRSHTHASGQSASGGSRGPTS